MCGPSFDTPLSDFLSSLAEQESNAGNNAAAELYRHRAHQARALQEQAEQFDPRTQVELEAARNRIRDLERRLADVQRAAGPSPAITPTAR